MKSFRSNSGLKQNISICGQVLSSLGRIIQVYKLEDASFTYTQENDKYYKIKEDLKQEIKYTDFRINTFMNEYLSLQ